MNSSARHKQMIGVHVACTVSSCEYEYATPNIFNMIGHVYVYEICVNHKTCCSSDYLRFLEIALLIFPQNLILGIKNYYHYVEKNCAITIVSLPTLHDVGYRLWERIFVYILFRKLTFYMENSRDDPYSPRPFVGSSEGSTTCNLKAESLESRS